MHNWANFCDITKFNLKNKNLVAVLAARFFLDENACQKLIGKTVYVVPPKLDTNRKFEIENAHIGSSGKLELKLRDLSGNESDLVGKSLLLSMNDAEDVFENSITGCEGNYIGKTIIDKEIGTIGQIKSLAGASAQKHFIVQYRDAEVLIPFVDDLIDTVGDKEIFMSLPKGILELNEG